MSDADDLSAALQQGDVSLDQATVIASAEASAPGAAAELVAVAETDSFHGAQGQGAQGKARGRGRGRASRALSAPQGEPFERHLPDAYASLLSGTRTGRARRPELVVLVINEVVKRGWTDVREGELCGNRFRTDFDHVDPHVAHGPTPNLKPRCWRCHQVKTSRDRKAGRLRPAEP